MQLGTKVSRGAHLLVHPACFPKMVLTFISIQDCWRFMVLALLIGSMKVMGIGNDSRAKSTIAMEFI